LCLMTLRLGLHARFQKSEKGMDYQAARHQSVK
jgi:hypothetical protein